MRTAYRKGTSEPPPSWCQDNKLKLNRQQNKGADRGLQEEAERRTRSPLHQWDHGGESQRLQVPRGSHQREDLTWTHHTDFITKSARQRLFFLRRLRRDSTWTPGSSAASTGREDPTGCITGIAAAPFST
ncbi:hypothetical protein L3Q82_005888 [Scortum barcoo]|uniref:Uncharacterized protein n=1 Tax=Scortum barcoo TaxID=214431 RepID=A0ACB8V7M6_9TELE|nr:hypothetical protein L3Q82_005888 [Scortum barcoo]